MRNQSGLYNLFSRDRKILYVILSIVMISILTLTVVYAALSTTLNINGNAEVSAASWDIYLDNVQLNSNSATTTKPTIIDKTTATFSTTLTKPGDFYEFSIDVVNNGSIDAMIDSVTKTPELSAIQAKYLKYEISYENGEAITTKQLVEKNSLVRLKVKVEYRKDLAALDLPTISETLNLSFTVNYIQSDDSSENVTIDNNGKLIKIVSGDYDTVGSEICIGEECFYVISSDEDSVTMLAKYNLYVGNECASSSNSSCISYGEEATGVQDPSMTGYISEQSERKGTIRLSLTNYWSAKVNSYPAYVYDNNSNIYNYMENYKLYLENKGVIVEYIRLIKYEELEKLGCVYTSFHTCTSASQWIYSTSYWTGTAFSDNYVFSVSSNGDFMYGGYFDNFGLGVRPVIEVLLTEF